MPNSLCVSRSRPYLLNEGVIADVYQPGMYTLTTQNMPILATLEGWKYGFESPFRGGCVLLSVRASS
jgi:membrane protease subunit (stomatin/prohibitin family)